MQRRLLVLILLQLIVLVLAGRAFAAGGNYVFESATPAEQREVKAALDASAFPWSLVPAQITIHVGPYGVSRATRGHVWLDRDLLRSGRFAWAIVQDEYAHQVDFFLFSTGIRSHLTGALGARDWCYGVSGLSHSEYGCERFASTLVWAYWPSKRNAYRPTGPSDEAAAMAPAAFRTLMAELVGAPRTPAGARL
jgi:hypothetical protein